VGFGGGKEGSIIGVGMEVKVGVAVGIGLAFATGFRFSIWRGCRRKFAGGWFSIR
jgi:hypothetical protein